MTMNLFHVQGLPGPPGDIGPEGVTGKKVSYFMMVFRQLTGNIQPCIHTEDQNASTGDVWT